MASTTFPILNIAPAQIIRGNGVLAGSGDRFEKLGARPLVVAAIAHSTSPCPFWLRLSLTLL